MPSLPLRHPSSPCTPEERTRVAAAGAGCASVIGSGISLGEHSSRGNQPVDCVCCGGSSTGDSPVGSLQQDPGLGQCCKRARRWKYLGARGVSGPAMPVDTFAAIVQHGMPSSLQAWAAAQELYFGGHPVLPSGWIRCFSNERKVAYYYRLEDGSSTFDWCDMTATPPAAVHAS